MLARQMFHLGRMFIYVGGYNNVFTQKKGIHTDTGANCFYLSFHCHSRKSTSSYFIWNCTMSEVILFLLKTRKRWASMIFQSNLNTLLGKISTMITHKGKKPWFFSSTMYFLCCGLLLERKDQIQFTYKNGGGEVEVVS